ncbi:uncharacterized protein LOC136037910 isoform X2 [Artemia franciscana]|uniref:uncharacterized protein LOC136037910 isoform X2 n=1 Tax=Artemia franciscana TaxID=6661 RepID=UPI0032DA4E49
MLSGLKPSANQVTSGNISCQNFSSITLSVIHEQESNQLSTLANLSRSKFKPNQQAMLHNQEIRLKVYKEIRKSGKSLKPSANQVTSGNISCQNFSSITLSVIHEQESNQLSTLANLSRSKFKPNQQAMLHNQEIRLKVYQEIRKSGKNFSLILSPFKDLKGS